MSKQCKSLSYALGGSAHTGAHVLPINALRATNQHQHQQPQLLTAGRDGAIVLYDHHAQIQGHVQLHSDWANDVILYSPTTVVSCSSDLSLKWWNFERGEHGLIGHHGDYVKCLATTSTPNHVLSGGLDKRVNLWDVERRECIESFANEYGEKGSIYSMASSSYSSAGNDVVVFGDNVGNVQLFDIRSSQVVSTFLGHKDTVKTILTNGQQCLSGSSDGTVRLWDLRNKQQPLKVHDSFDGAVWTIHHHSSNDNDNEIDDFENGSFYTGTSTGSIYHTEQNITKLFTKGPRGVLSLTHFQGELWSSSMNDSGLKNWSDDSKSKTGEAGLIKSRMLNNRRHVVTLSTDNTVVLWDILKCCRVKDFGSERGFESIIEELQTNEILPTWCSITIRAGKLFVVLRESSFTNTDVYGNDLDDYGLKLERDSRYNLGKIVMKSIFAKFVEFELQRDQLTREARIKELKGSSKLNILTKFSSHENSPAHTPTDEMKGYFSDTTASSSRRPSVVDSGSLPSSAPNSAPNGTDGASSSSSGFRRMKLFSRKSSRVSTMLSEEGESEPESNGGTTTLPSTTSTATTTTTTTTATTATTSTPYLPLLPEPRSALSSAPGSKDSSRKSSHVDVDTLTSLLLEIKTQYDTITSTSSLNNSQLTPPTDDEVPILPLPKDMYVIINERLQHSSAEIDIYSDELSQLKFPTLEHTAPKWIGNYLLRNRLVVKDFPKVGFVIRIHPGSETNLPGITNGETRLNAYSMLRVRRVLSYITDRLETKPTEVINGQDPETWLEALCHDTVLDNNMTLATLRSVYWKQSGDVVITYRRKSRSII